MRPLPREGGGIAFITVVIIFILIVGIWRASGQQMDPMGARYDPSQSIAKTRKVKDEAETTFDKWLKDVTVSY